MAAGKGKKLPGDLLRPAVAPEERRKFLEEGGAGEGATKRTRAKPATDEKPEQFLVRLPPKLIKAIKVHCAEEDLTQSDFAEAAFTEALRAAGKSVAR